jgi:phage major head subunit gpT-like protein
MVITTRSGLEFFFTGLEQRFWAAYGSSGSFVDKVATRVPSSTEQGIYGWIGKIDKMREWVGPRVTYSPAAQTYTLVNQPYELTAYIDKFKLQDDQFGIYSPTAIMMAEQSAKWPDFQLRDLWQNTGTQIGARQLGLDGLSHWSTAHPVDFFDASKGTYINDFRSGGQVINGVTVGGALTPQGYATLRQEMMSRKGEDGEPLGLVPDLLVYPPQLEGAAKMILTADYFSPQTYANTGLGTNVGQQQNIMKGSATGLMIPELAANPTTWMLLCTNRAIKPFIFQERQAVNFVYRISEQDPEVFNNHRYVFGTDARGALGWSHAWLSSISSP